MAAKSNCSICLSPHTNSSTCPLNPLAANHDYAKHPRALQAIVQRPQQRQSAARQTVIEAQQVTLQQLGEELRNLQIADAGADAAGDAEEDIVEEPVLSPVTAPRRRNGARYRVPIPIRQIRTLPTIEQTREIARAQTIRQQQEAQRLREAQEEEARRQAQAERRRARAQLAREQLMAAQAAAPRPPPANARDLAAAAAIARRQLHRTPTGSASAPLTAETMSRNMRQQRAEEALYQQQQQAEIRDIVTRIRSYRKGTLHCDNDATSITMDAISEVSPEDIYVTKFNKCNSVSDIYETLVRTTPKNYKEPFSQTEYSDAEMRTLASYKTLDQAQKSTITNFFKISPNQRDLLLNHPEILHQIYVMGYVCSGDYTRDFSLSTTALGRFNHYLTQYPIEQQALIRGLFVPRAGVLVELGQIVERSQTVCVHQIGWSIIEIYAHTWLTLAPAERPPPPPGLFMTSEKDTLLFTYKQSETGTLRMVICSLHRSRFYSFKLGVFDVTQKLSSEPECGNRVVLRRWLAVYAMLQQDDVYWRSLVAEADEAIYKLQLV